MLPPRSIAARAPALDRQVLRAILQRRGTWPRSTDALATRVAALLGRSAARWVAEPEDALLSTLAARCQPLHLALPSLGPKGYAASRLPAQARVRWMEPAVGRLDPGPAEVAAALDAGANAVLLAPLAGDCSALPAAQRLCEGHGAHLAVDARASMAARVQGDGPAAWGEFCLVPVDAEGGASPCSGAILLGDASASSPAAPGHQVQLLLDTVLASLRDEPHLRRLGRLGSTSPPRTRRGPPPPWALAAAAARADQSQQRSTQRAHHARTLHVHCSHLPAVRVPEPLPGHQAAGLAVPMLARNRDAVASELLAAGVELVDDLAAWLAPEGARGPRARDVDRGLLAVPLHPYYRPADLRWLAEQLRRATLRANGDGRADPSEAVHYAAKAAGED